MVSKKCSGIGKIRNFYNNLSSDFEDPMYFFYSLVIIKVF